MQSQRVFSERQKQVAVEFLRDNILKELDHPQEERRTIMLVDKNLFHRDQTNKRID